MRINVSLPVETIDTLTRICRKHGYTKSGLIRFLIEQKFNEKTNGPGEVSKVTARDTGPSLEVLKKIQHTVHDYGPNGIGFCFNCSPPHKKPVV